VPLPLFHATAMLVCWSSVIAGGAAMVIKKKFSVSEFWHDIAYYKATTFGYVGEMCKYLLNSPLQLEEKDNTLTKMIGNGMRPDIWKDFQERFGISHIMEFYGSSEGNIAFFNIFNMEATMGFSITEYAVVEYDTEKETPVKDKKGFLKRVKTNGTGLLLGAITDRYPYDGYTEADKTENTILRNVFQKGDAWFNTGDMVREMGWNHVQFVDRLGDTFRWKGENVSTQEVEGVLNQIEGVEESIVYGVEIPQHNGKAGMACLTISSTAEEYIIPNLYKLLSKELPPYAIPLFVRITQNTLTTDTFKHIKSHLKKDAFHITAYADKVYVLTNRTFILLTSDTYELILEGEFGF
jgi:citronellyl-CoA synthetase